MGQLAGDHCRRPRRGTTMPRRATAALAAFVAVALAAAAPGAEGGLLGDADVDALW